ncbi:MAG: hypothetical protein AAF558_03380 [Verrucomicrobiota bacterium]
MITVLEASGEEASIIDPVGRILDRSGNVTGAECGFYDFDVVVNLHYTNPKWLGKLSYVVNWNPLEYLVDDPFTGEPVSEPHLLYLMDCLRSHDRVLSGGSELVDAYASQVCSSCTPVGLSPIESPALYTTIPRSLIGNKKGWASSRTEEDFSVFYIGTNWEKTARKRGSILRHNGLFETLGKSGMFRFFGLRKQNGVELWTGVKGYLGELPFDGGISILKETIDSGVALVLSSEQHFRSGLVSTRIFQACAACAIIISDRNPFVVEHFGDTVRFFEYGQSSDETALNILEQVDWVRENWEKAIEMAEKAQEVFLKKFALELQLDEIRAVARQDLISLAGKIDKQESVTVLVHYLLRNFAQDEVDRCLRNLAKQLHVRLKLIVHTTYDIGISASEALGKFETQEYEIHYYSKAALRIGETIQTVASKGGNYHVWYSEGFEWSPSHVSNLLLVCRETEALSAYSPFFADFEELRFHGEMIRYFIKGLNGGYDRISERSLDSSDATRIPLGNILFSNSLFSDEDRSSLRFYDCLALFEVLRSSVKSDPETIALSHVVTANFKKTEGCPLNLQYSEYDFLPSPWSSGKVRDSQLKRGFDRSGSFISYADEEISIDELHSNVSFLRLIRSKFGGEALFTRFINLLERFLSRVR